VQTDVVLEGDCFDVLPTLPEASFDMVLTDPPYGKTALEWDVAPRLADMWAMLLRVGKPGCAFVLTCAQPFTTDLIASARRMFRHDWVWVKNAPSGMMLAGKAPMRRHETVAVFCRRAPKFNPQKVTGSLTSQNHSRRGYSYRNGASKLYSVDGGVPFVWSAQVNPHSVLPCDVVGNRDRSKVHPTQKPVPLFEYLVRTYSDPGDVVLDPFSGSGTTAVACANSGRRFVCVERDPEHAADARRRASEAVTSSACRGAAP
jgi:site-specific DNA-methyltransferase (adenine-specific)